MPSVVKAYNVYPRSPRPVAAVAHGDCGGSGPVGVDGDDVGAADYGVGVVGGYGKLLKEGERQNQCCDGHCYHNHPKQSTAAAPMLHIQWFVRPPIIEGNRGQSGDFPKPLRLLISQRFHRRFEPGCIAPGTERTRAPEEFGFAAGRGRNLAGAVGAQPRAYVARVSYVMPVSGPQDVHVELTSTQLGVARILSFQLFGVVPVAAPAPLVATVAPRVIAANPPTAVGADAEPRQVQASGTKEIRD